MLRLLYNAGIEDVRPLKFSVIHDPKYFTVFLNGNLVGLTADPTRVIDTVRCMRRQGYVNQFISISLNNSSKSVCVASDDGRLCRPYIIVEKQIPKLTQKHVDVNFFPFHSIPFRSFYLYFFYYYYLGCKKWQTNVRRFGWNGCYRVFGR